MLLIIPFVPNGARGLFGLGDVGGPLLLRMRGVSGGTLPAVGLELANNSDDNRGRFTLPASGESLLLVLVPEGIPSPVSTVESAGAPVVPPVLVVGSSGVALFAKVYGQAHGSVCNPTV
eukprot:COSAG02_NODE_417_length_22746_cov_9.074172_20_plen_119_part_00